MAWSGGVGDEGGEVCFVHLQSDSCHVRHFCNPSFPRVLMDNISLMYHSRVNDMIHTGNRGACKCEDDE